jgi:RNA polymerase sigma factor (sigma-70 family)
MDAARHQDATDEWRTVNALLSELSDGDREALLLYAWEDLTYPQIAVAMGIPVGTVRSRIHRARAFLRDSLHQEAIKESHS